MTETAGPLRRLLDGLYLWTGYVAGAFLVIIFALMMVMSTGREFGLNIPAGDDFAAWSMVGLAFLGLAHTFKSGEMIRVGLLLDRLSPGPRRILELLTLLIGVGFVGYFARHTFALAHDSWRFNDMSQGVLAVPLWIPQVLMFAGLLVLAIAMLDEAVRVARGQRPTYEKEPPKTTEELIERVAQGGGV